MKHLLNNLSEEEKNSIREQHEGGKTIDTSRFKSLLENKMGNVKPLVEQEEDDFGYATHDGSFGGDDSEESDYRMYDLPDVHQAIEDELEEMSDDEALVYLNGIIEFCEDKLYEMGQYGGSDEEEDLDEIAGVDYMSDEMGEEDMDLTEFDDLDEDETW